jgi:hypothetical protein
MTFDPAIRNRSLGAAMTLMERAEPMQAMAEMLAIAQVIERYELNTLVPTEVEQPETAQAAINDQIPHTGEATIKPLEVIGAEFEAAVSGPIVEAMLSIAPAQDDNPAPKAKRTKPAKKAKAVKKSKPVREVAGEPVPTPSQDSGNPVPANEDPVPGDGETMKEAA